MAQLREGTAGARGGEVRAAWSLLALCSATAAASDVDHAAHAALEWVAEPEAQCVQLGGTMTGLRNRDRSRTLRVWVERWYLDVLTADRSRHDLPPDGSVRQLGCSETRSGAQRWTVVDARFLPTGEAQ
mgnify:CR=1 FL=1|jgi:hypothetical protein